MGEDARQDRQDAAGHTPTERVSVPQAADHLGTTVDAIRKRVQRNTIPYEKDTDGRVWILLDTGRPRQDAGQDTTGHRQSSELVEELRDRLRFVERQLEAERQAHAEARRIIGGLVQRIPELEAPATPSEPRESPAPSAPSPTPPEGRGEAHGAAERPEEPRRSWWREFFGFD